MVALALLLRSQPRQCDRATLTAAGPLDDQGCRAQDISPIQPCPDEEDAAGHFDVLRSIDSNQPPTDALKPDPTSLCSPTPAPRNPCACQPCLQHPILQPVRWSRSRKCSERHAFSWLSQKIWRRPNQFPSQRYADESFRSTAEAFDNFQSTGAGTMQLKNFAAQEAINCRKIYPRPRLKLYFFFRGPAHKPTVRAGRL